MHVYWAMGAWVRGGPSPRSLRVCSDRSAPYCLRQQVACQMKEIKVTGHKRPGGKTGCGVVIVNRYWKQSPQ